MERLGPVARRLGRGLFAAGLAGLGVLSLLSGDFALNWQPVPSWVPLREELAWASGAVLLACGWGTLARRTARRATLALAVFLLSWLLLLQLPRVVAAPANPGVWLGFCENLVLVAGGWALFVQRAGAEGRGNGKYFAGRAGLRTARLLFAVSLPVIGLSHFVYSGVTASMVPAWLPDRLGIAYLTGGAHIAAGLGLLLGVLPRAAATLEAVMISLFVLLLHLPAVGSAPASRLQWTMLFVASALAGACWAVAGSLFGAEGERAGETLRLASGAPSAEAERSGGR